MHGIHTRLMYTLIALVLSTVLWSTVTLADPTVRFFGLMEALKALGQDTSVTVVKAYGDRFDPVSVTIVGGSKTGVDYSVDLGRVVRTPKGLAIYGTGETGTGTLTVDSVDYTYEIEVEPVCRIEGRTDCYGNVTANLSQDLIHYGLDDERIVTWDIIWVRYTADTDLQVSTRSSVIREATEQVIEMNEMLERSAVYARFRLIEVYEWGYPTNLDQFRGGVSHLPADAIVGYPDSDSAYVLNMLRYNISLLHDGDAVARSGRMAVQAEDGVLIID
jgi:hypothetical protein